MLDASWKDRHVVIEYSPRRGYGVSASDEEGFGVGPDEVYETPKEAATRVAELLQAADAPILDGTQSTGRG